MSFFHFFRTTTLLSFPLLRFCFLSRLKSLNIQPGWNEKHFTSNYYSHLITLSSYFVTGIDAFYRFPTFFFQFGQFYKNPSTAEEAHTAPFHGYIYSLKQNEIEFMVHGRNFSNAWRMPLSDILNQPSKTAKFYANYGCIA